MEENDIKKCGKKFVFSKNFWVKNFKFVTWEKNYLKKNNPNYGTDM